MISICGHPPHHEHEYACRPEGDPQLAACGANLNLSWPADHPGWRLETQNNPRNIGLSNNWVTVPGSTSVTSVSIPISPANPTVFYRLVYP